MILATLLRLAKLITRSKTQTPEDDTIFPGHIDISFFYQPPAEPAEPDPNTTQEK
jgi:hypothetical protein